jgi:hypothetical protein
MCHQERCLQSMAPEATFSLRLRHWFLYSADADVACGPVFPLAVRVPAGSSVQHAVEARGLIDNLPLREKPNENLS